jgi:serine/threonine protein kinase
VKPENCLFVEDRLKLADFGLVTGADLPMSRIGTRKYMPPDGRMDTRADVYAAGLVIYEMIAGLPADRFPRLGDRAGEVVENRILSRLNRLALRACQPDPKQRFQDAGQMLTELTTDPPAASRTARRGRRIAGLIACALIALLLVAAPWWSRQLPFGLGRRVEVNFITRPFNATVYLNGVLQTDPDGNPYLTPCTIPDLPARMHRVTFRREGLPELPAGSFDFATDPEIVAEWNLES